MPTWTGEISEAAALRWTDSGSLQLLGEGISVFSRDEPPDVIESQVITTKHVCVQAALDGLNGGLYMHVFYVFTKYVSLCLNACLSVTKITGNFEGWKNTGKIWWGDTKEEMM